MGKEIARLQYSIKLITDSQTRAGNPGLCRARDWLKQAIRGFTEAKKDNDCVFYKRIPDVRNLSTIGQAPIVKPTVVLEKWITETEMVIPGDHNAQVMWSTYNDSGS